MRKVYKINGKTEVHEVFTSPSGKTKYKVAFTKGNLDPKNRVPARFSTDSPIIQAVIENSPKFNRVIFLEKVYGNVAPAAAPVMNAATKYTKAASIIEIRVEIELLDVTMNISLYDISAAAPIIRAAPSGFIKMLFTSRETSVYFFSAL